MMRARHASIALAVLAGARVVYAEEPDLKQRGDEQMRALHYREALELYDRAWAATHDPAILYNRARAEQGLGDYPAALDAIETFVRTAPEDLKQKVPHVENLVEEIRARVALLMVTSPVAGASVMVDGKLVGTTPLAAPVRVAARTVTVGVEAPGRRPFHVEVKTTGGKLETVDALLDEDHATTTTKTIVVPVHVESRVPTGYLATAYTFGALGLAGLAIGATFGGLVAWKSSDSSAHCPGKVCDASGWRDVNDGKTFATLSDVGFIAGGALLATSIVLFIVAPRHRGDLALAPIVGPGFVGIGGSL